MRRRCLRMILVPKFRFAFSIRPAVRQYSPPMPQFEIYETIPLLVRCTILLALVLGLHQIFRDRSASLRHGILSLGLLVLPISIAMQSFGPTFRLTISNHWLPFGEAGSLVAADEIQFQTGQPAGQLGVQPDGVVDGISVTSQSASDSSSALFAGPEATPTAVADLANIAEIDATHHGSSGPSAKITTAAQRQGRFAAENIVVASATQKFAGHGRFAMSLGQVFGSIWLLGSSFLLIRIAMSWWLARIRVQSAIPVGAAMRRRLIGLTPALAGTPVDVRVSERDGQMPICIGFWKPTIILPREFRRWSENQLRSVLNHELAHAVRRDAWVNLWSQVQEAVLWFHPLNILVSRRRRRECEIACDDWAISQGLPQRDYARALLDVASNFRTRDRSLCHPMAARCSALDRRIKSILATSATRLPMTMRERMSLVTFFLVLATLVSSVWVDVSTAQEPTAIRPTGSSSDQPLTQDSMLATGDRTIVKAVNLGNWLLLEPWLLDITEPGFRDQSSIFAVLNKRFGEEKTAELLTTYRKNWIKLSDLQAARSLGFNAVRLPFDCGLLEDAGRPRVLRDDAFLWLDHAVNLCSQAGLSVILDLHGAPGGQSLDGPSGDATSNRLWTDPDARQRTVWLWQRIAEHFADHKAVIAYDVVNEPYGDFGQDLRESMLDLFSQLYVSIRKVDPQTLIYAPATLDGFAFYGNPAEKGWKHVGFTQHAYPGLFDGRPAAVRSHDMFLQHWVEPVDRLVDELDVPFLLGEYNVVFEDAGGAALTAWYAQEYERRGWSTAIWTLKRLLRTPSPDVNSWSLLTNATGLSINLRSDSFAELSEKFRKIGDVSWHADEKFSQALKDNSKRWQWPGGDPWQSTEIETDVPGTSLIRGENWVLKGAGRDIFGKRDRFHFRSRMVGGDFEASCRVLWIDETSPWAKAGWMVREDDSADAAHLLLHTTPDGKIMLCGRDAKGQDSWQKTVGLGGLPVRLGVKRQGDVIRFAWSDASGRPMTKTFSPSFLIGNENTLVGMAVCSLVPGIHTSVGLDHVAFKSLRSDGSAANFDSWQTKKLTLVSTPQEDDASESIKTSIGSADWSPVALQNPSFEIKGDSEDRAEDWSRWGDWMNRETTWSPVQSGAAIIAYHHYKIQSDADSGLWQNVKVHANQSTRFRIHANADPGGGGGSFAKSVELRLEVPGQDGTPVAVASETFAADQIATDDQWSTLEIIGTPTSDVVRLIVCVTPATGEGIQRDGAVKFDAVQLDQRAGTIEGISSSSGATAGTSKPGNQAGVDSGQTALVNGSFETAGGDNQIANWSHWGDWLGRQDGWSPVRDGNAILAYEHYQTTGSGSSGVWQDIVSTKGAKVKFSVYANVDLGKPGGVPPGRVELRLESPLPDGKTVTLAKKTFDSTDLANANEWSLLTIEATSLGDQVRCLIIAEPNSENGERDGALKFDQASVTVTLE